jgi:hypothetical protein
MERTRKVARVYCGAFRPVKRADFDFVDDKTGGEC